MRPQSLTTDQQKLFSHPFHKMSSLISRLITRKLTPEEDFQQFLDVSEEIIPRSNSGFIEEVNEIGDEVDSEISESSTATIDDNPGPGRTIDKYFYQKAGKKVEQIYFRVALPSLSTGQVMRCIARYKEKHRFSHGLGYTERLDSALGYFSGLSGSLVINGLKVLLHRSRLGMSLFFVTTK